MIESVAKFTCQLKSDPDEQNYMIRPLILLA